MGFYPPPMSMPVEVKKDHASDPDAPPPPGGEPTNRQVRWTLRVVFVVLVVLALLCLIGPHIPAGG